MNRQRRLTHCSMSLIIGVHGHRVLSCACICILHKHLTSRKWTFSSSWRTQNHFSNRLRRSDAGTLDTFVVLWFIYKRTYFVHGKASTTETSSWWWLPSKRILLRLPYGFTRSHHINGFLVNEISSSVREMSRHRRKSCQFKGEILKSRVALITGIVKLWLISDIIRVVDDDFSLLYVRLATCCSRS